jgi:tetratricopeptide (TPR) repeat protein
MRRLIYLSTFAVLLGFNACFCIAQPASLSNPVASQNCGNLNVDEETAPLRKELLSLLRDKKYAALDDMLNDRHARMLKGEFTDQSLVRLTNFIDTADTALEPLLNEWVRTSQGGFMALLVRGKYHTATAWKKRGTEFADKTSNDQLEAMAESFKKAFADLVDSKQKQPRSILPYPELMQIASAMGQGGEVYDILMRANEVAPHNYAARRMAVVRFSPKWGGSFEEMDKVVTQSKTSRLPAIYQKCLEYSVLMEKASHFKVVEKRPIEALPYYTQAAQLCDSHTAWAEVSSIQYAREDWPAVEAAMNQYMRLRPDTAWGFNRRAWALEKQGRVKDAVPDYERSAELGNDYAQNKMGYFYLTGNPVSKDLVKAKALFEKANAQGNKNAKAQLEYMARLPAQQ